MYSLKELHSEWFLDSVYNAKNVRQNKVLVFDII